MRTVLVGALLACAWLTESRAAQWRNDLTIWRSAAAVASEKPRPHVNTGRALFLLGRPQEAARAYATAIALSYDARRTAGGNLMARLSAQSNLAHLLLRQGQTEAAWNLLEDVLRDEHWPDFPYALWHRGTIYAASGACEQATRDQTRAQALDGALQDLNRTPCTALTASR